MREVNMRFEATWQYYDAIYRAQGKDYQKEAACLRSLIADHGIDGAAPTLLDVACGTGRHLEYLAGFERVGTDLDPNMLAVARDRLKAVRFEEADMRALDAERLRAPFDVVTCLFSAIAYMPDQAALDLAVGSMAGCLGERGVLIIEPFIEPSMVRKGVSCATFVDEPELKLARINYHEVVGNRLEMDFHYLIADNGTVRHETETHILTLFEREAFREAFERAGLQWTYVQGGLSGRGLHIGQREWKDSNLQPPVS